MANAVHLAELEIAASDVTAAWAALEPVVAQCVQSLGAPTARGDYHVGGPEDLGTVVGADLGDCLDRVENPTSVSVTYTTKVTSDPEPRSVELRVIRYRRHRELGVHIRVAGPGDMQALGLLERTEKALAQAIERYQGS